MQNVTVKPAIETDAELIPKKRTFTSTTEESYSDDEVFTELVVNIYNRYDGSLENSDLMHKGNYLIRKILKHNRMLGYSRVSRVRPIYGEWMSGSCQCPEKEMEHDVNAEQMLYDKIYKARETGEDFFYMDGDLCICAIETNNGLKFSLTMVLKLFWMWLLYIILK